MKKTTLSVLLLGISLQSIAQKVSWVSSTQKDHWVVNNVKGISSKNGSADVEILTGSPQANGYRFWGMF
jgi:glucosylceramidase